MNMYTKKFKKMIIIILITLLFTTFYPKKVMAALELEDIVAAPAKIFWMIEEGVLVFLNNLFTDGNHKAYSNPEIDGDYVVTELNIYLTPENIIKGKFILFDADIFKDITTENKDKFFDYVEGGAVSKGKIALRNTISGWYYSLRNLAIVALLSVLLYVGIRMITSTIAQDKAKYKVMFKDWLVALCLVILLHYIMIGILNITSIITDALGGGRNTNFIGALSKDISGILGDEGDSNDYTYNGMDLTDAYAKVLVLRWNYSIYIYICSKVFEKGIYNNIFNTFRSDFLYNLSYR